MVHIQNWFCLSLRSAAIINGILGILLSILIFVFALEALDHNLEEYKNLTPEKMAEIGI